MEFKTFFIIAFIVFFLALGSAIVFSFDQDDLLEICDQDSMSLYYYGGNWVCFNFSNSSVKYWNGNVWENVSIWLYNQTLEGFEGNNTFVPYVGSIQDLDLGSYVIKSKKGIFGDSTSYLNLSYIPYTPLPALGNLPVISGKGLSSLGGVGIIIMDNGLYLRDMDDSVLTDSKIHFVDQSLQTLGVITAEESTNKMVFSSSTGGYEFESYDLSAVNGANVKAYGNLYTGLQQDGDADYIYFNNAVDFLAYGGNTLPGFLFTRSLIPNTPDTLDLGSSDYNFANLYLNNGLYLDNSLVSQYLYNQTGFYYYNQSSYAYGLNTSYGKYWYNQSLSLDLITYFNVTYNYTYSGTSQGSLLDLLTYDSVSYNVSEQANSPALDFVVNFTNVDEFNQLFFRLKTTPTESHSLHIYLYDYDSSSWESYSSLGVYDSYSIFSVPVLDSSSHISEGVVSVRFYISSTGNVNHKYQFDFIKLSQGYGFSLQESDPIFLDWLLNNYTVSQINVTDSYSSKVRFQELNTRVFTNNYTCFNTTLFSFTTELNTNYTIDCVLYANSSATTSGVRLNLSGPINPVNLAVGYRNPDTTTIDNIQACSGNLTECVSNAVNTPTSLVTVNLWGRLNVGSTNNRNLTLQVKTEIMSGVAKVFPGSYCRVVQEF